MECHAIVRNVTNNLISRSYSSKVFKPTVATVAVRSKAKIMLLLLRKVSIICFSGFVKYYFDGEERAGCFTLIASIIIVLWLSLAVPWAELQCLIVTYFLWHS